MRTIGVLLSLGIAAWLFFCTDLLQPLDVSPPGDMREAAIQVRDLAVAPPVRAAVRRGFEALVLENIDAFAPPAPAEDTSEKRQGQ